MKKVLLGVLGAVVLAVLVVAGLAATKPDTFRFSRNTTIKAPAATIFANLDDFKRWNGWSPWEHLDPKMHKEFSGPDHGVGASYAWQGNSDVGKGRMTIQASRPSEQLDVRLQFIEPFPADNRATFVLTPTDGSTAVEWIMTGENNFMSKVFSVFADVDALIGKDFELGLANLKQLSESGTEPRAQP